MVQRLEDFWVGWRCVGKKEFVENLIKICVTLKPNLFSVHGIFFLTVGVA